jgi:hypothetical protein
MIDDYELVHEGRRYVWSHHTGHKNVEDRWSWSDPKTYTHASVNVCHVLNRRFISDHAADAVADLDDSERGEFIEILRAMGATESDFEAINLNPRVSSGEVNDPLPACEQLLPAPAHTPYSSPAIRDWYFDPHKQPSTFPKVVCFIGTSPFDTVELRAFLLKRFSILLLDYRKKELYDEYFDLINGMFIVGRDGWSNHELDDIIDDHVESHLRIYSQEMFLAFLMTQCDPFFAPLDVLSAYRLGHPALEFVSQGWPGWVSTFVTDDRRHQNIGRASHIDLVEESPLHSLGYRVGKTGESIERRCEILRRAFTGHLPIIGPQEYMEQWGEPGSPARLRRMADHISARCTDFSGRHSHRFAVADWREDLEWLRINYYHGHFQFGWPSVFVR